MMITFHMEEVAMTVAVVILLSTMATASHAQERIAQTVVGSGAVSASTSQFNLHATVGQTVIASLQGEEQKIEQGFWHSLNSSTHVSAIEATPTIGESQGEIMATASPNPLSHSTNITLQLPQAGNLHLRLYDALGRELWSRLRENQTPGTITLNLETQGLPSGQYVLECSMASSRNSLQLIIAK